MQFILFSYSATARWLFECPVNFNGLAGNIGAIELFDSVFSLVHALVLYESVALDVTCPSVDVEHAVLDFTILAKSVLQVLFLELLVQSCDN